MAKTIFNMADGILTPCNVARLWHWFRQVTAPCNVPCGSRSWQSIHPAAAPCSVIRGSGMTCHWILPVAASFNVTRSSEIMTFNLPLGSTLQCGNGSGMTCYWIRSNVNHIGGLHLVSISTTSRQSTCHSAPDFEILSKSDHPWQKKMTSCRFSSWRISAILDFKHPIMGSLKSLIKLLSFPENRVFASICKMADLHFGDRLTDRQADGQHRCIKPLSLSWVAAQ